MLDFDGSMVQQHCPHGYSLDFSGSYRFLLTFDR